MKSLATLEGLRLLHFSLPLDVHGRLCCLLGPLFRGTGGTSGLRTEARIPEKENLGDNIS